MIHPYEWSEYRLLVTVRNCSGTSAYLLNKVPQEEFFEHFFSLQHPERPDRKRIVEMTIMTLTAESYELLKPEYSGEFLLED